jgi:hypothetical protein
MIDSANSFASPADALATFSAEGLTFTDPDGVEHIIQADINGLAICEWGERFTMTDPGDPLDPINFPPTYVGDGLHWVAYRHLGQDVLPAFLAPTAVWHSDMVDGSGILIPRPTDGSIPNQFWL